MSAVTGIFVRVLALPDNDLLIVNYEIFPENIGKIQLSNTISLFNKKDKERLKEVLRFIEDHSTSYYIVPKQNSKP